MGSGMPYAMRALAALLLVVLTLTACQVPRFQARTDGYGEAYTQFGRD